MDDVAEARLLGVLDEQRESLTDALPRLGQRATLRPAAANAENGRGPPSVVAALVYDLVALHGLILRDIRRSGNA